MSVTQTENAGGQKTFRTMTDQELTELLKKEGRSEDFTIGPCPCCGKPVWQGIGEICSVCFWEQFFFDDDENEWSDPNGCTLRQWREFFASGRRDDTAEDHAAWWEEYVKAHPEEAEL